MAILSAAGMAGRSPLRGSAPGAEVIFEVRRRGRDALEHGHDVLGLALRAPGSQLRQAIGGQRADHGDAAQFGRVEGQQLALVLQQHDGLARDGARRFAMIRGQQFARLALRVVVLHGFVEQAELLLDAQDAQHRLVE